MSIRIGRDECPAKIQVGYRLQHRRILAGSSDIDGIGVQHCESELYPGADGRTRCFYPSDAVGPEVTDPWTQFTPGRKRLSSFEKADRDGPDDPVTCLSFFVGVAQIHLMSGPDRLSQRRPLSQVAARR